MGASMTPLELAARALHRRRVEGQHPKPDNFPWEGLSRREQALLRADVYAVLKSVREPSKAMRDAGIKADLNDDEAVDIYRAMIDAMLEEG